MVPYFVVAIAAVGAVTPVVPLSVWMSPFVVKTCLYLISILVIAVVLYYIRRRGTHDHAADVHFVKLPPHVACVRHIKTHFINN
jgi:hypothetical protein